MTSGPTQDSYYHFNRDYYRVFRFDSSVRQETTGREDYRGRAERYDKLVSRVIQSTPEVCHLTALNLHKKGVDRYSTPYITACN